MQAEVDGVDITTATLPDGWADRLIAFPLGDRADSVIGWCLNPHDLVLSKSVAGRSQAVKGAATVAFSRHHPSVQPALDAVPRE